MFDDFNVRIELVCLLWFFAFLQAYLLWKQARLYKPGRFRYGFLGAVTDRREVDIQQQSRRLTDRSNDGPDPITMMTFTEPKEKKLSIAFTLDPRASTIKIMLRNGATHYRQLDPLSVKTEDIRSSVIQAYNHFGLNLNAEEKKWLFNLSVDIGRS